MAFTLDRLCLQKSFTTIYVQGKRGNKKWALFEPCFEKRQRKGKRINEGVSGEGEGGRREEADEIHRQLFSLLQSDFNFSFSSFQAQFTYGSEDPSWSNTGGGGGGGSSDGGGGGGGYPQQQNTFPTLVTQSQQLQNNNAYYSVQVYTCL